MDVPKSSLFLASLSIWGEKVAEGAEKGRKVEVRILGRRRRAPRVDNGVLRCEGMNGRRIRMGRGGKRWMKMFCADAI